MCVYFVQVCGVGGLGTRVEVESPVRDKAEETANHQMKKEVAEPAQGV